VDDPLRGIVLVLVAMASFSVSDAVAKHLSFSTAAIQIAWLRWLGFLLIMAPCILASRGAVLRSRAPLLQLMRTLGILGSAVFFIAGLGNLPLADAAAITFVAPLLVTALSIPLLREPVGPRRWAAVVVGLIGVLIVIRPGSGAVGSAAVFPLLSALSWAFGMVFTRKLGGIDGAGTTMSYSALAGFVVLSLLVPFDWKQPALPELGFAALMAVASTAGQFLVVTAYRLARASILAPISYSQLVWSGLLGLFVFGNMPDAWTLLGVAIIIASGVYTAHRERVTSRSRVVA
jgi:drug/metabolite transporter (DMT)-like permease